MTQLIVKKEDGEILFDTSKITYGLVKSGNLVYTSSWSRRTLNTWPADKNNGANWTASNEVVVSDGTWDAMYGFSVSNFKSPLVFIVGPGVLTGTVVSGTTITFVYACSSPSTKFYCFDLMSDNITGHPYLKTFDSSGNITFNSLQPALNIVTTVQAPVPSTLVSGYRGFAYNGGTNTLLQQWLSTVNGRQRYPRGHCTYDYPLSSGVEYAACLPWSRGCGLVLQNDGSTTASGCSEGAFGRVGGISFQMGHTGGTTFDDQLSTSVLGFNWYNVPTDRYPTALVIKTAGLPFPYN
jgi:hypothetical protein